MHEMVSNDGVLSCAHSSFMVLNREAIMGSSHLQLQLKFTWAITLELIATIPL